MQEDGKNQNRPKPQASSFLHLQPAQTSILVVATAAAIYLCWQIARPFIDVATWALAFAVVVHPVHRRFARRMRPNAAALAVVVLVAIVIIVPAIWLGWLFVQEASIAAKTWDATLSLANLSSGLERFPQIQRITEWLQARLDLDQEGRRLAGMLAARVSEAVRGSIWILTEVVLSLVTTFFFLRDRDLILGYVRGLLPLSSEETAAIFERAAKAIGASLTSNLLVKLVQGLLAGLMYWVLGLPAPVLLGAATALLGLLPFLGTGLVWGSAAIILAVTGSWGKAIALAVWGGVVVATADNVLYPILVAEELRVYRLAVFFAVFGGLIAFGFTGIVLGPLILAITAMLIDIWATREKARNAAEAGG